MNTGLFNFLQITVFSDILNLKESDIMKKIAIIMILSLLFLTGCSGMPSGDDCDFLINADWEGTDQQCTNSITFGQDMFFGNSCACGSPVGDGDITEIFRYIAEDQSLLLYDCDEVLIEEGKVLFCDDTYLVVNLWDDTYCYQNLNTEYLPEVHEIALEVVGTEKITKPLLYVVEASEGTLTVSSHYYDGDSKDLFTTWQLPVADGATYKSVTVNVVNDVATLDVIDLTDEDIQYIGEYYTGGYFEFNEAGEVTNIIFYGETTVWDSTL